MIIRGFRANGEELWAGEVDYIAPSKHGDDKFDVYFNDSTNIVTLSEEFLDDHYYDDWREYLVGTLYLVKKIATIYFPGPPGHVPDTAYKKIDTVVKYQDDLYWRMYTVHEGKSMWFEMEAGKPTRCLTFAYPTLERLLETLYHQKEAWGKWEDR